MEKERIDYIDLMKGICIILVVFNHTGIMQGLSSAYGWLNGIVDSCVPVFFMLSGLFFSRYGSFGEFLGRRFRSLVVPILVFGPLGGVIMQTVPWTEWSAGYITRPSQWVAYLTSFTNVPLWFLRSLFLASLLMYGLHAAVEHRRRLRIVAGVLCLMVSVALFESAPIVNAQSEGTYKVLIRNGLLQTLLLLPFLYAGNMVVRAGVLGVSRTLRNRLIAAAVALVAAAVCALVPVGCMSWYYLLFDSGVAATYAVVLAVALLVWAVSFIAGRLPYVSYLGRYSLVVLVVHYPMLTVFRGFGLSPWPAFLVVLALLPAVVWLCVRYIPWACGARRRVALAKSC